MYARKVERTIDFIMSVYDTMFSIYDAKYGINIYNKLYETASSNIHRIAKQNQTLWAMQDIRGINTTTHAQQSVQNVLINIIPKYRYNGNLVHLNYKSIIQNTRFQVLDIEYEFDFVPLSSSRRDEDMNSEFDKFESFLQKTDEGLIIQNQVASDAAIEQIRLTYGPFDQDEIDFYKQRLTEGNKYTINAFQKGLVFNLFFKFFGDTNTINAINLDDYIILIIAAKRILKTSGLILLPYIVSSKILRLASRKSINKKELMKLESSPLWEIVKEKYRNDKIEKYILSIIAMIFSSDFEFVDYEDDDLDGNRINIIPDIVCEEVLMYISLI